MDAYRAPFLHRGGALTRPIPMEADKSRSASEIVELTRWASAAASGPLNEGLLARAARVLTDDLAAMIGARDEPEVAAFHSRTLAQERPAEATVFRGGRAQTDRLSAAVANAVAADWLELDEGYRQVPCHAGLYVLPALLAEAEFRNLPVERMLTTLVVAYELVTRIARAWTPKALVMQSHGRYCAIGAAAAVGLSRGLDPQTLCAAIGTAVTLTGPSPRTHLAEGVLARNVWPATGAWGGSMAVEWAQCGIAGSPVAFYDTYSTVLGGSWNPGVLITGLGERYAIDDGYTKIYACCQHLHSAVEATLSLRGDLLSRGSLDDIASIDVESYPMAMALLNDSPQTTLGAKFSMSHAVAAALATGTGGADAFTAATLTEQTIARLRHQVRVAATERTLPPPNDRPARVRVRLRSGTAVEAECLSAAGGPDRPLPPSVVFEKLQSLASPVYPQIASVMQLLVALDPHALKAGWSDTVARLCQTD